jgi:hypothetical protein
VSNDPKIDPTSLGSILLKMGAISEEELLCAVEEQRKITADVLLGKLLIAHGFCTEDQVEVAVRAQLGMRSDNRADMAMGLADIAAARKKQIGGTMIRVLGKVRGITSQDNPMVTPELLGKSQSK